MDILARFLRIAAPGKLRGAIGRRLRGMLSAAVAAGEEGLFPLRVRHLSGPRRIEAGPDELVVVCLVRDGAVYLTEFLAHYRALGARHVVFLDNGSTDGTVELASAEPGVTVLQTLVPYRRIKVIAKRYLTRRFGRGCWVLCVDIDEFFDYPHRSRRPLRAFLRRLRSAGYTAVVAHLLDLFPRGPLQGASTAWRTDHRFFSLDAIDRQPYREKYSETNYPSNEQIAVYYGGVREEHFGVRPMLTKHPLQFPSGGLTYVNSHNVRGARVADVSAVLLHYKYVSGFVGYAQRLVREGSFYNGSAEYKGYLDALERTPSLDLHSEGARELHAVDQLVEEGFLVASDAYRAWASGDTAEAANNVSNRCVRGEGSEVAATEP
jgi:hypothetical protein